MKILVIGSGGREHALVWKLAQSPHVTQMWCAPGNAGIQQEKTAKTEKPVECVNIAAEDLPKLLAFAQEKKIELTVVGPDNPLALGIVDPRLLYHSVDSELMALWMAHFALKREAAGVNQSGSSHGNDTPQSRILAYQNVDQQMNVCESLLL